MDIPRFTAHLEMHIPFYEICYDNKSKILDLENDLKETKNKNKNKNSQERSARIVHEIKKLSCISVIFSSSGLENFIYKYAVSNLTQKYYEQNLDRLSTYSKWRVIPKLCTGKELSESSRSIQMLNELVKVRNDIVHYKGIHIPDLEKVDPEVKVNEIINKLEAQEARLFRCAKNSPDTMANLLNDLVEIGGDKDLAKEVKEYLDMGEY